MTHKTSIRAVLGWYTAGHITARLVDGLLGAPVPPRPSLVIGSVGLVLLILAYSGLWLWDHRTP